MASSSKKRRVSRSPSHSTITKRVRRQWSSISQQGVGGTHHSRAKSVFRGDQDPYLPNKNDRATSLPTSDDWTFRVKVISSSTDLNNDVFKKAVQGLVKICFPQGVLEELGIQVLEQHMKEENAPKENIKRMIEVFRAEMIHRTTWMLAEYLDSPARIEAGLQSVLAASARVHGDRLGLDVLGDVSASFIRLRERLHEDSTMQLASGTALDESASHLSSAESEDSGSDGDDARDSDTSSASEPSPPPVNKKKGKSNGPNEHGKEKSSKKEKPKRTREGNGEHLEPNVNISTTKIERDVSRSTRPSRNKKDNKISATWRWDINPSTTTYSMMSGSFKRPSDLFAYHALPIAREKLGSKAEPKELIDEIQTMLGNMSDDEFTKWVESFEKLGEGDLEMLQRPRRKTMANNHRIVSSTPSPKSCQRRVKKTAKKNSNVSTRQRLQGESVRTPLQRETQIKIESSANTGVVADILSENITSTTTAFRHLSTEAGSPREVVNNPDTETESSNKRVRSTAQSVQARSSGCDGKNEGVQQALRVKAELVNLLWPEAYNFSQRNRGYVVKMIFLGLDKRVTTHTIDVTRFDGTTVKQTKDDLRAALFNVVPPEVPGIMEHKLIPWMIANPAAFPELVDKPIFFAYLMPYITPVLHIVCGARVHIERNNAKVVENMILDALSARGIPLTTYSGVCQKAISNHVKQILQGSLKDEDLVRGLLERQLRELAFKHRQNFPELKNSALVKVWERETGHKW